MLVPSGANYRLAEEYSLSNCDISERNAPSGTKVLIQVYLDDLLRLVAACFEGLVTIPTAWKVKRQE